MTPEEAIRMLTRLKDQINFEWTDAQKKMDALNMAIDLLLRYDDLISRTELIHKLRHLEQFNNKDVPDWVWSAIGGTNE